jgi:hypothetical protein
MQHDLGGEDCIQGFGWKARRKETTRKTQTMREVNIKMDPREEIFGGIDCINLSYDMDQWRALLNTMNLRVS